PGQQKDVRQWCESQGLNHLNPADEWHKAGEQFSAALKLQEVKAAAEDVTDGLLRYACNLITSSVFDTLDCSQTWFVKGVLVAGEPGVLGGPYKSLKTSIAVALALSIATGKPFLGCFDVVLRCRVAIISSESGKATLRNIARRVAVSMGVNLSEC